MSLLLLLNACKEEGMGKNANGENTFTYEPISWTMVLPEGWNVLSAADRDKLDYAAENFYEEANSGKKSGAKKIILGVKKADKDINSIYAFVRSYERDEDYPRLRDLLRQQKRQYSTGEYQAHDTLIKETIGGHEFEKGILTVSYAGKPYYTYTTYSTMLDTLNFGVSIVTNNAADEEMLNEHFRQSAAGIQLSK